MHLGSETLKVLDHTCWSCEAISFVSLIIFNLKPYQVTDRLQARDLMSLPTSSLVCSTRGHAIANAHKYTLTEELQQNCRPLSVKPALLMIPKDLPVGFSLAGLCCPLAWSVFFFNSSTHFALTPFLCQNTRLPRAAQLYKPSEGKGCSGVKAKGWKMKFLSFFFCFCLRPWNLWVINISQGWERGRARSTVSRGGGGEEGMRRWRRERMESLHHLESHSLHGAPL